MARGPAKAFPDRKISETFLQFSAPLLHSLRCDASERQIRQALAVAYTAWNAVIFADVLNNNGISARLDPLRSTQAGRPCL